MRKRFNIIIDLVHIEGFFEADDGTLAGEFCSLVAMFGSLPDMKTLQSISRTPFRLEDSHQLFEYIHSLILHGAFTCLLNWKAVLQFFPKKPSAYDFLPAYYLIFS